MLDIQKLAAELGLKCITTYKLDALKSVQQINQSHSQNTPQCEVNESIQNSEPLESGIEQIPDTALGCTDGEFTLMPHILNFTLKISYSFFLGVGGGLEGGGDLL